MINNQVVTSWFPDRERAGAIGFYVSGQFIGLAFLQPLLLWLVVTDGWRAVFYTTGLGGILWGFVWLTYYRGPRESKRVNAAELELIESGGGLVDLGSAPPTNKPSSAGPIWAPYSGIASCGASISASSR
jgi:ACS family D-galactonate transporter-like MFS transporter